MKNSELWQGKFGDDYTKRQKEDLEYRERFFARILDEIEPESVCEFGANIGENLRVIDKLYSPELIAIEINPRCCDNLRAYGGITVYEQSVTEPIIENVNLVFCRGLLIHLPKKDLDKAINNMYTVSNKYILVAEYHSPKREMIEYRGMKDMMWRDSYWRYFEKKGCELIDCGFDAKYDITWFLLMK